ncbi:MAG TPA: site-2 protease family protein [Phenylobacterium sp.]|uniref:site-2 protease family protein n=1 Tax=Phenylobacterium sp. TaxID=1871053 RepID=UPI002B49596C|nr:site-2 protease family protein [Phenylobacterium sp.]HKR89960.1 site-2 protease family protein [Phenylobacterium sp.]
MSKHAAVLEASNWPLLALALAWVVGDSSTLQTFQGLPDGALGNAVFIFGAAASIGVHELALWVGRLRSELAAAALGLVSNLVLAAAMLAAARIVYVAPGPEAVVGALAALVTLNIVFMAMNLLPALPFDGGRILSALVSGKGARARLASRLTSACTEATGWLFLVFGLASGLADGPTAGIVWLLIGVLVLREARSERRQLGAVRDLPSATTSTAASSTVRLAQ